MRNDQLIKQQEIKQPPCEALDQHIVVNVTHSSLCKHNANALAGQTLQVSELLIFTKAHVDFTK